jgi:IS605 OrfB family transposase
MAYFERMFEKYGMISRYVWKRIQTPYVLKDLNASLQRTYNIDKRTANSILRTMAGRLKALKELKKTERVQLAQKIEQVDKTIAKQASNLDKLKERVVNGTATEKELVNYRREKRHLWHKKQKRNRMIQSLEKLERNIKMKEYSVCWGTKKLFKAQYHLAENGFKSHEGWRNAFRKKRDSQMNFIGSKDETMGNSNAQLTLNPKTGFIDLQIRKDKEETFDKKDKHILIQNLHFKHLTKTLIKRLNEQEGKDVTKWVSLTIRILRRENKWYLQVMFPWCAETDVFRPDPAYGTIGLDYNDGFIELAETDYFGNLIHRQRYNLNHHGTGNKASSEIQEVLAKITDYAQLREKPIVVEFLDFKKKKAKQLKAKGKQGKQYNRMLHLFDYSRYKERLLNRCIRKDVFLLQVNPAYTSKIGKQKYSKRMKLTVHQAAAYVIARKGQGFKDTYKKK